MSYRYFAEVNDNIFTVCLAQGEERHELFEIESNISEKNGNRKNEMMISITWDRPENFKPSETGIEETFVQYLQQHTAVLYCIDVYISHAVSTTAVNYMADILMKSLASAAVVKKILLHPSSVSTPIPTDVCVPFLAINNRTILTANYDSHLLQIFEQITDERMYPRYTLLKQDSIPDQSGKEFMRKIPDRAYSPISNIELVTYDNISIPDANTVVLMQYMRAMKQYEQEKGLAKLVAWVLKYWTCPSRQGNPDDPTALLPSDLTENYSELAMMNLIPPNKERLWVPQVRLYPERNQSIWVYDQSGIVTIDGDAPFVYTFPNVGMTMSTILDMMNAHAEPLNGTTIELQAEYEFKKRSDSDDVPRDWQDMDLLVNDCKTVGFACVKNAGPLWTKFYLEKSHKVGHRYKIVINMYREQHISATVTYTINRSLPVNADHGVGESGIHNMDTGVHCARCMKPVLGIYR